MLLVSAAENIADPVGKLLKAPSNLSGSVTLRLLWIHFGPIGFSHGPLVGSRQGTIRTPHPVALTARL